MKRILASLAAMVVLLVAGAPVAQAAVLEIPIDTVVEADAGSITLLATADVPADLVGTSCGGVAQAHNQSSVHPGNDLIVASGSDSLVLHDVERESGAVTTANASLTLGETVTVSLQMGHDEVFSGGIIFTLDECAPPTTTTTTEAPTTTTTTQPTTTSTQPPMPEIVIEKTADPVEYGQDGIGHFTIRVTNPGPVDLTHVRVTDDVALAVDSDSNCPNPDVPDLAVGEHYEYDCTVGNLDGVSPFKNEATAIGRGPNGLEVIDTDDAIVVPPILSTTITQPPTTAPPPTLPETGPYERVQGFGTAGFSLLALGAALLGGAALLSHREGRALAVAAVARTGQWLTIETKPLTQTIYLVLRPEESEEE